MGMPFTGLAKAFMEHGPHRIGSIYRKAIYREYTDGTFSAVKPRPAEWEHAGILGLILRAEVGDTIKVVFKNNGTHPYSMHPHGVCGQTWCPCRRPRCSPSTWSPTIPASGSSTAT
jgi:hypothetical protein